LNSAPCLLRPGNCPRLPVVNYATGTRHRTPSRRNTFRHAVKRRIASRDWIPRIGRTLTSSRVHESTERKRNRKQALVHIHPTLPRSDFGVILRRRFDNTIKTRRQASWLLVSRAYFNMPTGTDVLGDLKSVLEGLVTRA